MQPLQLIREESFPELDLIVEQDNNSSNKILKITGPYIVCEQKNANGRVYKTKMMEKVVEKYRTDYIETKRAIGEMNHPEDVTLDYNNACHLIEKLERRGDVYIGTSKVLTGTPKGDLLAGLLENGVRVGISTRGVGKLDEKTKIVEKYTLIGADIVADPSGPGAFVDGILESKQYMIDTHGDIIEMAYEAIEENIEDLSTKETNTQLVNAVTAFLRSI